MSLVSKYNTGVLGPQICGIRILQTDELELLYHRSLIIIMNTENKPKYSVSNSPVAVSD